MRTVGIDLAAASKGTAVAVIDWSAGGARVASVELGLSDDKIVATSRDARIVGIDCAFGWPIEFVEFVAAHGRREVAPRQIAGADWRRRLAYRETDRVTREITGRWPLSVSTDRLGMTAMHCAELLDAFEPTGGVDRSGGGRYAEVYPAAATRHWGIETYRYKTNPDDCALATGSLRAAAPWLEIGAEIEGLMSRSHDAFDAVIASLNARAVALGQTLAMPDGVLEQARVEGWIALPTGALGELVSTGSTTGVSTGSTTGAS